MKRILATALAVLLIASMAIGGSVAYLTSTDSATNVFTMGEVKIEQHEKDSDNNSFAQNQLLLPSSSFSKETEWYATDGTTKLWTANNGEIDKIVTVENKGKTDAFVRTIFAFENTGNIDTNGLIIKNINYVQPVEGEEDTNVGTWKDLEISARINGEQYRLYSFTYKAPLAAGVTSQPSLRQVAMAAEADNEVVKAIREGGDQKYSILVATQAVQAANMVNEDGSPMSAEAALDAAFDEITADNNPWRSIPAGAATASTASELIAALNAGGEVYLTSDIQGAIPDIEHDTTINLFGNTFKSEGAYMTKGANLTVKDGTYSLLPMSYTSNVGTFDSDSSTIAVRPENVAAASAANPRKFEFTDVVFDKSYNSKTSGMYTDQMRTAVRYRPGINDDHARFVFKNCTFNNENVSFYNGAGKTGCEFEAIFENCTFKGVNTYTEMIEVWLMNGTITFKNCKFDLTVTTSSEVVDVDFSSAVTIKFEGTNTLTARKATATTDPALVGGREEVKTSFPGNAKVTFIAKKMNGDPKPNITVDTTNGAEPADVIL